MNKKKILALLLTLALCLGLFAACTGTTDGGDQSTPEVVDEPGDSPDPDTDPVDDGQDDGTPATSGNMAAIQDLMVCVGPDPESLDPALNASVDGSIILNNAFSGLYGYQEINGEIVIVADCAEEVVTPTEIDGGKFEYVVKLKDGLLWSDGEPMKASDFTYAWNRAVDPANAADYQYIFDVIDGYDEENPSLNISADDEAGTVTIVTSSYTAYFDQLLAFPTYYPVREDLVEAHGDNWATNPDTYISNGAFRMTGWTVGSTIDFERNENYWDAANVKLDTLTFALSDDDDAIYMNFDNGTYKLMRNVPISMIQELTETRLNDDFYIGDYIGTYFLEFNVEESLKPGLATASDSPDAWTDWTPQQNAQVRRALSLLIDRNYIVTEITQSGEIPAYGFVPQGMDDGTGSIFRDKANPWWGTAAADLDSNRDEALAILQEYYDYDEDSGRFTNFPAFEYSVNPTSGNLAIAAAIQDLWADYGIDVTIDNRTWAVIQTALTNGDFTMSRLGWIADYNDPINFLEIYVAASGNNHPRLGKEGTVGAGAYYGPNGDQTWFDAYESLINQIKVESDVNARADLMYQAEEILRDSYAVLPLYYYTNPYMASQDLQDYVYSPLGWISFKQAYLSE